MGALLAIAYRSNWQLVRKYLTTIILPIGIVSLLIVDLLAYYKMRQRLMITLDPIAYSLIFCWIIGKASMGFRGTPGKFLELKPLVYIGRITYGIYIYHNLVPLLFAFIFSLFGRTYPEVGWFTFVTSTALTILIASLSWKLFEYPINALKRNFRYDITPPDYVPTKVAES